MNSKIISIITTVISILSIVIVILFGLEAERIPANVPVQNIMFVDRKDGDETNKIKKNKIDIDVTDEIYTMYYCFVPYNASNRKVNITCSNGAISAKVVSEEGGEIVIQFDESGEDIGEVVFTIYITSADGNKTDRKVINRTIL